MHIFGCSDNCEDDCISVSKDNIHNAALKALEAIKKELPEEAQCITVIKTVLVEAEAITKVTQLKL